MSNVIAFTRTAAIAAVAATAHPALSRAELACLSPHERLYFTDEPVAHLAARADFERHLMIEKRNADAFAAARARRAFA